MLLALAKKLRAQISADAKADYGNLPIGSLTVIELYAQPRYGEIDGIGPVRIEGEGNMVGFSPVTKCVAHGETAWIPTELIRNVTLDPLGLATTTSRSRK
jgi:hypothetical protein